MRGEPAEVYAAALALAGELWSLDAADVVARDEPVRLVHAVQLDGEIACWLSWSLEGVGPQSTRIRLVHDELVGGQVPPPELDQVLELLRARLVAGAQVALKNSTCQRQELPSSAFHQECSTPTSPPGRITGRP